MNVFQKIQEKVTGVDSIKNGKIREYKIISKSKLRGVYSTMNDFVYILKGYMSDIEAKDVLIKNDNVSLFALSHSEAVFVRSTKGVNIYDPSVSSFFFHAQYQFAEDFIFVPLTKFEDIAKQELESLSLKKNEIRLKKMIVIASHPRSGGTFLTQCFLDYPGTKIMNEPPVLLDLYQNKSFHLLKSVLFYMGKDLICSGYTNLAIKFPGLLLWLMKYHIDISNEMPFDMHFLFLHRNPVPSFKSWMKLATVFSYDELRYVSELPFIGHFFPDLALKQHQHVFYPMLVSQLKSAVNDEKSWYQKYAWMEDQTFAVDDAHLITTAVNDKEETFASTSFQSHFLTHWLIPMLIMRELIANKKYATNILSVSYEALIEDPQLWFNTVLPFCKMNPLKGNTLPLAFERDSQRMSIFNRKELSKNKFEITSGDKKKMSYLLKKCQVADDIDSYHFNFSVIV